MAKYAIVRKAKPIVGFEYMVYVNGHKTDETHNSYEAAVLACFDLAGWIGDYTIRFCDDEMIFHAREVK